MLAACATAAPAPSVMAPGGPAEALQAPPSLVDNADAGYAAPIMPSMLSQVVLPGGTLQPVAGGYWMSPLRAEAIGQVVDGNRRVPPWLWYALGVASGCASAFGAWEACKVAGGCR